MILENPSIDINARKKKLRALLESFPEIGNKLDEEFKNTEKHLKEKDLPESILERHKDFVAEYENNRTMFDQKMKELLSSMNEGEFKKKLDMTIEYMKRTVPDKKQIPLNPSKLPERTSLPGGLKPRLHKDDFIKELKAPGDNSKLVTSKSAPPGDEYLQETGEIQFSEAIKAKAKELSETERGKGPLPVIVYEWVKNNVEYVPVYGSIQGADKCLETMKCNSFDTASLLISLYRYLGIHARYAYGAFEMSAEKFMNWTGGFTDVQAAMNFAASGGIPVGGIIEGGKIKTVQFEHMIVEAWVDYFPSRGSRHRKGDTWIRLDPSYKKYEYTDGIPIADDVPFDSDTLFNDLMSTATYDQEGNITGVDPSLIEAARESYHTEVLDYMSQSHPDAETDDLFWTKKIIKKEHPYLMGTLQYKRKVIAVRYSELPDSMRHTISFTLSPESIYYSDTSPLSITKSLPEIAGKKITVSYSPALPEDEAVIQSYLPELPDDGSPVDPSLLPSSLPAYLINLKPELRIDGEVVATGGAVPMGTVEKLDISFSLPLLSDDNISNHILAGEYFGIMIDTGVISQNQVDSMTAKLEDTQSKIDSGNFSSLDKEDLLGDMLYSTALLYFYDLNNLRDLQSKRMKVNYVKLPSMAIFSYKLNTNDVYGVPVSANESGLHIDVDRNVSAVKPRDGNFEDNYSYKLMTSFESSVHEHVIPESLYSFPDDPVEGVSAFKALDIAWEQDIPLYSVTEENIEEILPQLTLDSAVINDIINGVNAGLEVTVSRDNIDFEGWHGCGYVMLDSDTGGGAFMISGGYNGGAIARNMNAIAVSLGLSNYVNTNKVKNYIAQTKTKVIDFRDKCKSEIEACIAFVTLGYFTVISHHPAQVAWALYILNKYNNMKKAESLKVPPPKSGFDKYYHCTGFCEVTKYTFLSTHLAMQLGVLKELYDEVDYGNYDWEDIVADIDGICAGLFTSCHDYCIARYPK